MNRQRDLILLGHGGNDARIRERDLRPHYRSGCWLARSQDDDRVVDLFEGVERGCGNAEDGGQHPGWKRAEGLTYADVVFSFRRTGVLDDHDLHLARALVLEVVE